jgi:hypothetical protein
MADKKLTQGDGRQPPREGDRIVEELAKDALGAFRTDAKEAFDQLVKTYDGAAAIVGVFGLGSVTIAVSRGQVHINPNPKEVSATVIGRGAIYPETLVAISRGEVTVLDAFHKGDLLARAESGELHRAYGHFVKFSDAIARSEKFQGVLKTFRARANC